jgi:hypothetical protein
MWKSNVKSFKNKIVHINLFQTTWTFKKIDSKTQLIILKAEQQKKLLKIGLDFYFRFIWIPKVIKKKKFTAFLWACDSFSKSWIHCMIECIRVSVLYLRLFQSNCLHFSSLLEFLLTFYHSIWENLPTKKNTLNRRKISVTMEKCSLVLTFSSPSLIS